MKTYLHSLFNYILHPHYFKRGKNKFSFTRILFFLTILLTGELLLILIQYIPILQTYFAIQENAVSVSIQSMGIFNSIMFIGIAGPCCEEFIFRVYLKRRQCFPTLCIIQFSIILNYVFNPSDWFLISFTAVSFLLIYIIYIRMKESYPFKSCMYLRFRNYFWVVYYSGALSFGLLHISNLQMLHANSPFALILVLPQIYAGLVLGFVRMQWGIRESICLHMLNNILAVILFSIFATGI